MPDGPPRFQLGDRVCVATNRAYPLPGGPLSSSLLRSTSVPDWWPAVVDEQRGPRVYILILAPLPDVGLDPMRVMAHASAMLRLGEGPCHGGRGRPVADRGP